MKLENKDMHLKHRINSYFQGICTPWINHKFFVSCSWRKDACQKFEVDGLQENVLSSTHLINIGIQWIQTIFIMRFVMKNRCEKECCKSVCDKTEISSAFINVYGPRHLLVKTKLFINPLFHTFVAAINYFCV